MTRITKGRSLFAPSGWDRSRPSHTPRRTIERWAGVAVVIVTGAVLAATTLAADHEAQPVGHPLIAEHTNNEGSVRDSASSVGHAPNSCMWTSEVNEPVFPAEDIGGPPTLKSVLIFESCDGELTGTIAWFDASVPATCSASRQGVPERHLRRSAPPRP